MCGGCHGGCSEFKHVHLMLPIADAGAYHDCQLAIHYQTVALITQNLHPVSSFSNHNLQPHCSITVARFPHLQRYCAGQLLQHNRQADVRSKSQYSGVIN